MSRLKRRHKNSQRGKKARTMNAHRAFVRLHVCSVPGCKDSPVEAAHYDGPVPHEDMGGTALKRHDRWCFALCRPHHQRYHQIGWAAFDKEHGIDTRKIAEEFARQSPALRKAELTQ